VRRKGEGEDGEGDGRGFGGGGGEERRGSEEGGRGGEGRVDFPRRGGCHNLRRCWFFSTGGRNLSQDGAGAVDVGRGGRDQASPSSRNPPATSAIRIRIGFGRSSRPDQNDVR